METVGGVAQFRTGSAPGLPIRRTQKHESHVGSEVMDVSQQPREIDTQPGPEFPTLILDGVPTIAPAFATIELPKIHGYEIIRLIDQGGMSNIYLAKQKGLERFVAVKMIRPQDSFDSHLRKQFILEASSIASLQHPNVVEIHEIGEANGMPYLCLEYIAGGNLERKLREQLPSSQESAEIVRQLAEAIQAAHDHQIIHRDLKPSNVLCDVVPRRTPPSEETGRSTPIPDIKVKLTDFGLACVLCEINDQTKPGFAVGTPSFMSPEQASGTPEDIGKATDIYGLGAILYELLTGEPPFLGDTASETLRMVRMEAPIPPSRLNLNVPHDLERICLQCLEKDPKNRYASAGALAIDLRRFLMGRSVAAHPLGPIHKCWRRCRRHPFYSLALLAIAILTIAVGLSLFQLKQVRDDFKRREREIEHGPSRGTVFDTPTNLTASRPSPP